MLSPDVNILVYAHREDETKHAPYRAWLEQLVSSGNAFGLSVLVAAGFVRLVTNKKIYADPTPLEVALTVVDQIAATPNCRILTPQVDHLERLHDLARATKATGKLYADAQHAAIAIAEGCTWVTRDKDFARFARHGLRWEHLVLD